MRNTGPQDAEMVSVKYGKLAGISALRARIGGRLAAAFVLYTGSLAYTHEDGTTVLPLDALWTGV